jgi:hypothetical protein
MKQNTYKPKFKINKKKKNIKKPHSGEFWSINDSKTKGHKSLVTSSNKNETKKGSFQHLPITHALKTRDMKNIELLINPDSYDEDPRPSHILPKTQKSKIIGLGKKHNHLKIKNPIDKSIIRNIKKKAKKR